MSDPLLIVSKASRTRSSTINVAARRNYALQLALCAFCVALSQVLRNVEIRTRDSKSKTSLRCQSIVATEKSLAVHTNLVYTYWYKCTSLGPVVMRDDLLPWLTNLLVAIDLLSAKV